MSQGRGAGQGNEGEQFAEFLRGGGLTDERVLPDEPAARGGRFASLKPICTFVGCIIIFNALHKGCRMFNVLQSPPPPSML